MMRDLNDRNIDENRWIQAAQQGDMQAFSRLYDHYVERLYAFIYHKTFHRETARDLTQSVFLKVIEQLDRLDVAKGSFSTWLFAIARNRVTDHYRCSHPSVPLDDIWDLRSDENIQLDEENRERFEALHQQLSTLKPEQRELLTLKVWQELSFSEIAEMTGGTSGSCKMAFHRLIKQLRKEMHILVLMLLVYRPIC